MNCTGFKLKSKLNSPRPEISWKRYVFQELKAVAIPVKNTLTTEHRRQADLLFDSLELRGYKQHEKRNFAHLLFQALLQASCSRGAVMFPRRESHPDYSYVGLQVIEKMVNSGLVKEVRSKPGRSSHMSRLLPTEKLLGITTLDPWTIDEQPITKFVYLHHRRQDDESGEEIEYGDDQMAEDWQFRLEHINKTNNEFEITYLPYNTWKQDFEKRRLQLRPIHFARFTDNFELHGRLYTGKYGHQGLRKIERRTIHFCDAKSIELDYSGLHTRMMYHLADYDYNGDPYALWGGQTTPPMRLLAKTYINALINAKSPEAAVSACNFKMTGFTKERDESGRYKFKDGKAATDAFLLREASRKTGIKFSELHPLVIRKHKRIADQFGCDLGIRLMRQDADIALSILHHFTVRSIPCLSCHDSFIVPKAHRATLKGAMEMEYHKRFGYLPTIKC